MDCVLTEEKHPDEARILKFNEILEKTDDFVEGKVRMQKRQQLRQNETKSIQNHRS